MMISTEQERVLWEILKLAFMTAENFGTWLERYFTEGRAMLINNNLGVELTSVMAGCRANGSLQNYLQALTDDPPDPQVPPTIYAITGGVVKRRSAQRGPLLPHQRVFVASRPFVNRSNLRQQLHELANSVGGKRVLVIDGDERCGKSFSMSMAIETSAPSRVQWLVDVDEYAKSSAPLDARALAVAIVGEETGCPLFDTTKENEAVPRLMIWMVTELQKKEIWIIIDHCNRQVMTHAAGRLLKLLIDRLYQGGLDGVRLILADFNSRELPVSLQRTIRHDRAELPTPPHVEDWCRQVAILENRGIDPSEPAQWSAYVFENLDRYSQRDGSWQHEFEKRLMDVAQWIRAHKEAA